ncbi:MAG: hypothetical protein JW947_08190 [Sedimentisphaerales bacterium]|nr:hypothetical protein [Sedimentisphaerales bacterium]
MNNLKKITITLVLALICATILFAGDVIVKDGQVDAEKVIFSTLESVDSNDCSGSNALSLGYQTTASGDYSIAVGDRTQAIGDGSFAAGQTSQAAGYCSIAVGYNAKTTASTGIHSVAMGYNAEAANCYTVAIGKSAKANGQYGLALGLNAEANGMRSVALGYGADANALYAIALGNCQNNVPSSFAVGFSDNVNFRIENGKANINCVLKLEPQATPPTGTLGCLYVKTDGTLYFHDGNDWKPVQLGQ